MSSNSPCAACKFQRRKCTPECIFAPYFPPEDPQKFVNVHKVFGGSNVSKILSDINPAQREDAAKSLAYEAQARMQNPVYGCVSVISRLQQRLAQINNDLDNAKKELATYIGPSAMLPTYPQQAYGQVLYQPHQQQQMMGNPLVSSPALPYTNLMGIPNIYGAGTGTSQQLVIRDQQVQVQTALPYTSLMPSMMGAGDPSQSILVQEQQQQHEVDSQRYGTAAVVVEQNELMSSYEMQHQQQQQQQNYILFKNSDHQYENGGAQIVESGFTQMAADEENDVVGPSLALGVNYDIPYNQIQQQKDNVHHALQAQLVLQSQQQQHPNQALQTQLQQQHKAESDAGRSPVDPAS